MSRKVGRKNEGGLAKKILTPALLQPEGTSEKEWAKGMVKGKAGEWGKAMQHAGPWWGGLFPWAGDDNATIKDIPGVIKDGLWF